MNGTVSDVTNLEKQTTKCVAANTYTAALNGGMPILL